MTIWNLLTNYMGGDPQTSDSSAATPAVPAAQPSPSCYAIDPLTGQQLKIPPGVSLQRNAQIGADMGFLPSLARDGAMASLFAPHMPWDYQRVYGQNGHINKKY